MKATSGSFGARCAIGICARFSHALARRLVLPLFALYLGAEPEAPFAPHSTPSTRTAK